MSKRVKFFYNGILLTLVGFAMRAAGLFLGAYISGAIGAEGVGLSGLITTVYAFAVTFATSGVSLSVTRLVAAAIGEGDVGEGERVLRGAFLYASVFGALATVALFTLSGTIGALVLSDMRAVMALRVLALSLLPIALSAVISGYFVAVRRVTLNAAVNVVGQAMRIVLTVLLLTRFSSFGVEYSVFALALGITATEVVCFIVAFIEFIFDRRIYKTTRYRGYATEKVAKMALPIAFSQYVRSFLLSLEHIMLPRRLQKSGNTEAEALASYGYLHGMALPIILFPMTPLSSFSGLLVPEFAESEAAGDKSRMERIAGEALSKTLMYAVVSAVFLYIFAEEIGYVIYSSYEAGHFIALLTPIIPIMYLDHVTDAMLKGVGEQVFSMWVNIADSLLSVILVFVLIPIFDISGYAIVIIAMEVFNFTLSFLRLRRRVRFKINLMSSVIAPLVFALCCATLTLRLFDYNGSVTTPYMLTLKMIFALCAYATLSMIAGFIVDKARAIAKKRAKHNENAL